MKYVIFLERINPYVKNNIYKRTSNARVFGTLYHRLVKSVCLVNPIVSATYSQTIKIEKNTSLMHAFLALEFPNN